MAQREKQTCPCFLRVSSVACFRFAWLFFVLWTGSVSLQDARGGETYAEAYAQSQEQGKPILAFVGAAWCPACQAMKRRPCRSPQRHALDGFALALVDLDRDGEIGRGSRTMGPFPNSSSGGKRPKAGPFAD